MYHVEELRKEQEALAASLEDALTRSKAAYVEHRDLEHRDPSAYEASILRANVEFAIRALRGYPLQYHMEKLKSEAEYAERCAAVLHNLDVSPEDLKVLETMQNDSEHRPTYKTLNEQIASAVGEVKDAMREYEQGNAILMLEAAGFQYVERDDFEGYEQARLSGVQQVAIESQHRPNSSDFWYEFVLERDGVETLRGKSGEFGKLLEACGISQNVEAKS